MVRIFAMLMIILLYSVAQADVVFLPLAADDLNGRSLNLPADFPRMPTIVFIAHKREQQPRIDAWVERLGLRESNCPAWVESPVVERGIVSIFR